MSATIFSKEDVCEMEADIKELAQKVVDLMSNPTMANIQRGCILSHCIEELLFCKKAAVLRLNIDEAKNQI